MSLTFYELSKFIKINSTWMILQDTCQSIEIVGKG